MRGVTGWLADFFRFAWGLLYWNTRKSWFRWRRGRVACPCQSPSDSGRAFETQCEASMSWNEQLRFRRVCPLLVKTENGLRCSANTADVRPFWGRTFGYYGGTAATIYLVLVLGTFAFLRTVGYPVSVLHVMWPGSWHRITEVRGWYFMNRAEKAFAAGQPAEGMLYLTNAYQFDPHNYRIAIAFAQKTQLSSPVLADQVYQRLLAQFPSERAATAQLWFRALLARGDFSQIEKLAADQILGDSPDAPVWMRALIFASRQTGSTDALERIRDDSAAGAAPWHQVMQCELLLRAQETAQARALLERRWDDAPAYAWFYQVSALIELGDAYTGLDLLESYGRTLDDIARATLHLRAYAAADARQSLERYVDLILSTPLGSPAITLLSAHLIRYPSPAVLDRFYRKFIDARIPLTGDTLGLYLSVYAAVGAGKDIEKMRTIADMIRAESGGSPQILEVVRLFFLGESGQARAAGLLGTLPTPMEVHYALLEKYPGKRRGPAAVELRK